MGQHDITPPTRKLFRDRRRGNWTFEALARYAIARP